MIVCMTSASAEPRESAADDDASQSTVPADSSAGPEVDGLEEHDGSITIREAGTVVDAMYIRGAINVRADDVTIKNSVVSYGGYHSIRIFPGADGTRILDTDVYCLKPHTNGVVFGNYYAENVALHDCRNDFMFSGGSPAQIVTSSIDGVPYVSDTAGDWSNPTPVPKPEASEEPSGEPTQEPSGEPTEEPSAEASATTDFPDADSTGVPDGVSLTASGSLNITKDGTVVDGLHVRGTITIAADDVTVRNTLVQGGGAGYPINVQSGTTGALIEHVEVDNLNSTGIGILMNGSGTIRAADIHSAEDGIRIQSDDVTIEDSYIHDLHRQPGGHHDTIQIRSGDDVTIRGNNLQPYVASTDDPMNAAIQIGSLLGADQISNFVVVGNLMNGGNYTIQGGGRGEVDSARYSDNLFGRDFRYGPVSGLQNSTWEPSNVWADTGEPVE